MAIAIALPANAQVNDEIIVTATKRTSTLQETPVAVTVTNADVIEKAQILDIKDLQSVVPTFRVSQLQNTANTTLTIRGFGNGGNNYGIEPAVGLFIDGVYRSRAAAQISDLPALERVEVLSGPQTTLFGKNASAGVVSIVTEKPQFDTQGYVEAGYGNYNQNYVKGYITGGVSENVAVSLGGGYQKRDGYIENIGGGGDELNNIDRFNLRGQILWEPSDELSVRVIGDLSTLSENCCGTTVAIEGPLNGVSGPTAGNVINLLGGQQNSASDPFTYKSYTNRETLNQIDDSGISGQIDYDLGFANLTSITAFRSNESDFVSDSDFNSADILKDVFQQNTIDTFTQEVRLTSNGGETVDWMIGGYYFDETIKQGSGIIYGEDTRPYVDILSGGALDGVEQSLGYAPGTFFAEDDGVTETFRQDDKAYSIFGTVDFNVSDRLTLTAGGNYTNDKKNVSASTVNTDVFGNLDLQGADGITVVSSSIFVNGQAPIPGVLPGGIPSFMGAFGLAPTPANIGLVASGGAGAAAQQAFAQYNAGVQGFATAVVTNPATNPLTDLFALQFQPQFLAYPNSVEDGQTKDDKFTYTLKAAYEINDNLNVYGSYATGFKASSWNLTRDSRPFISDASALQSAGLLPNNYVPATGRNFGTRYSGPETTEVFELGAKARFDKGAINIAVFDQTINNFQSTIFQGTGFVLANAGQQSTQGIEFDTRYTPVQPLTLTFSGVLQDPTYDSFVGAPVEVGGDLDMADGTADGVGDISGQQPAGINKVVLIGSATYTHDFANGMSAFIRGNYQYEDKVQVVDNIPGLTRDTNLFNGSLGFDFNNGIELRFWGRNLFNQETFTSAFPGVIQAGTVNAYPNQPRTYGVAARYSF
jgi:outer membrane receptor protein involved in Fe transport